MAARPLELALLATAAGGQAAHPGPAVTLKRALIGRPRPTGEMDDTLLSKKLALPIFASDPLSSVAYATEQILLALGLGGWPRSSPPGYGATPSGRKAGGPTNGETMIVLGIVLIILGALLDIGILYTIGLILLVVGVVLWILGAIGRPFMGRRYYY